MKWLKIVAIVAMFAVGFGAVFASTAGLGDTEAATAGFLTQAARRTDVTASSAATGTVTSAASYALTFGEDARLAGSGGASGTAASDWMVEQLSVAVGDRVSAGQLLATASTIDIERDLSQAETALELARIGEEEAQRALDEMRKDIKRQLTDANSAIDAAQLGVQDARVVRRDAASGSPKRLARIGFIQANDQLRLAKRAKTDLQAQSRGDFPDETIALGESKEAMVALEQQMSELTDSLQLARIVAPVDGVVSAINIRPDLLAPASDAIVVDSATLTVIADVVESDISAVALGQTAMVSIDALDIDVAGTVTTIASSTDGGTSSVVTFPVTVTLIDPDPAVRPGMSTDVEITIAEAPGVVAVPVVALRGSQGAYTVDVAAAGGGVEARQVSVGIVTESLAEIQSGLSEGEAVVIGTDTARVVSDDEQAGFGGPGGFGGGFRGLQGGGGGRGRGGGGR